MQGCRGLVDPFQQYYLERNQIPIVGWLSAKSGCPGWRLVPSTWALYLQAASRKCSVIKDA
eukprot:scaffold489059_cov37-Prasinocladus_malaysianus.AAC.1